MVLIDGFCLKMQEERTEPEMVLMRGCCLKMQEETQPILFIAYSAQSYLHIFARYGDKGDLLY